jgi:transcriptional regulator with XRE-family HTH domain
MTNKRLDPTVVMFGINVQRVRETHGWSARELARRSDVAVSHIIAVEHGAKDVGLSNALRISRAVGVTLYGLTKGEIASVWLEPGKTGPEALAHISYAATSTSSSKVAT